MDIYVPIDEAAKLYNQSKYYLNQLVQIGKIKSIQTKSGEILVREDDLDEFQNNSLKDLENKPISIGDASRKYKIPHPTISRWVQKGYIRRLGNDGQKVLIDEADIARQAQSYLLNPGQGHWTIRKSNIT